MKQFYTIILVELKKIYRDKISTIVLILPILAVPMVIWGTFMINRSFSFDKLHIGIVDENNHLIMQEKILEFNSESQYDFYDSVVQASYHLKNGDLDGIIYILPEEERKNVSIELIYNSNSISSVHFTELYEEFLEIEQHNILSASPYKDAIIDLSHEKQSYTQYIEHAANEILVSILPILIVSFIVFCGGNIAIDITTGEKERGTLADLLLLKLHPSCLILSKAMIVFLYNIVSLFSYGLGFGIAFALVPEFRTYVHALGGSLGTYMIYIQNALSAITFSVLIALLFVLIGITSKNINAAHLKLNLVSGVPVLVSCFLLFIHANMVGSAAYCVPIINIMFTVKFSLLGVLAFKNWLYSIISNIVISFLLFKLSMTEMAKEKNIF